jgi:hypothetical protein
MSSSITIPTRTVYADSGKACSSSSSSSEYSCSPRTPPQQADGVSARSSPRSYHDRRPSLLSKFWAHVKLFIVLRCYRITSSLGLKTAPDFSFFTNEIQAHHFQSQSTLLSISVIQTDLQNWWVMTFSVAAFRAILTYVCRLLVFDLHRALIGTQVSSDISASL